MAGNGIQGYSGDGGPAISARLSYPEGVAVDTYGNIYIADISNSRIRKVNASGIISTVAGDGTFGYSGDGGPATNAVLNGPRAVAVDTLGNIYIADTSNLVIRMINASGIISTVAGDGTYGSSGNGGLATKAKFHFPIGIAVNTKGNIYIADDQNYVIQMFTVGGNISTVAGTGSAGYNGDNILATKAQLNWPLSIAVDTPGNIYIADYYNNRIRMVTESTGNITTIAGNGNAGFSGDGDLATKAELNEPGGVAVDTSGNIYFSDSINNRIRMITKSTGNITTIAGSGAFDYGNGVPDGDGGPATSATLSYPIGVARDTSGNIYVSEFRNARIKKITPPPTSAPTSAPTVAPTYTPTSMPTSAPTSAPTAKQQRCKFQQPRPRRQQCSRQC